MNRMMFQEVEDLFARALGFDEPRRRQFLDEVAREHSREIQNLLERLLAADQSDTRWTELGSASAGVAVMPAPEPSGKMMDRFRLIERLGVGGHGEVYLAEQIEPVRRRVALKMVRPGVVSEHAVARFKAEQQALARMSHPGIAGVYEAGLADHGRMFFAMEYVEGAPIDEYCDRHRLTVRQRLELLLRVCQAVQHAHQRGLIHRDIKPTNILVTQRDGEPTPMLIDFGIAVATQNQDISDDVQRPDAVGEPGAAVIGTPAYMSPEQAGRTPSDVDTRCDVYALGVVLCELLTGRTPFDVQSPGPSSPEAMRRAIVESPTIGPVETLERSGAMAETAATNRSTTPRRLRRTVRGDLDAIVRRAIARERAQRYQTVDALAADIRNVLEHRPAAAANARALQRTRQFVRRHLVIVSASAVTGALMVAAVVGTTLGMKRAESEARESKTVSDFLQTLLTFSRADEKGSTVRFVDVLADGSRMAGQRFADYPEHEGQVRMILGQTYYSLAMYTEARNELERASSLLTRANGEDDPSAISAGLLLAQTLAQEGDREQAIAIAQRIADRTADARTPDLRERNRRAQWFVADALLARGKYDEVERRMRELIPVIDAESGPLHVDAYNARLTLAKTLSAQSQLAEDPTMAQSLNAKAADILTEIVALQRRRFDDPAAIPFATASLFLAEIILEQRRFADIAEIVLPLTPAIRERYGTRHWLFFTASAMQAIVQYSQGDAQAAADTTLELLKCIDAEGSPRTMASISRVRDALPFLDAARRTDDGVRIARSHVAALTAVVGPDNPLTSQARLWLARFLDLSNQLDEAGAIYRDVESSEGESPTDLFLLFHAGHLARVNRVDDALASLTRVCELKGGMDVEVASTFKDRIALMYAEVLTLAGRQSEAHDYQRQADGLRTK